jgi:hypothetical protein
MNFIKVSADEVIWQQASNSWQVVGHSDFYLNITFIFGIRGNVVLCNDPLGLGSQTFRNVTLAQTGMQPPQMDTL